MKPLTFLFANSAMVELFREGRALRLAADLKAVSAPLELPLDNCQPEVEKRSKSDYPVM